MGVRVSYRAVWRLLILGAMAAVLGGCFDFYYVTCLNPVYTEESLTSDPGLEGTWTTEAEKMEVTLTFRKAGEKTYRMRYLAVPEKPDAEILEAHLEARLARIGDRTFLDLYPRDKGGVLRKRPARRPPPGGGPPARDKDQMPEQPPDRPAPPVPEPPDKGRGQEQKPEPVVAPPIREAMDREHTHGVGLKLSYLSGMRNLVTVHVSSVVDGSPADLAGIRANDRIRKIDDLPVEQLRPGDPFPEIDTLALVLWGPEGSEVTLTVSEPNGDNPVRHRLARLVELGADRSIELAVDPPEPAAVGPPVKVAAAPPVKVAAAPPVKVAAAPPVKQETEEDTRERAIATAFEQLLKKPGVHPELVNRHWLGSHIFLVLERDGDSLRLISFSGYWLIDLLEAHPGVLPAAATEDFFFTVLTASSRQMHRFLVKYGGNTSAFDPSAAVELSRAVLTGDPAKR